MFRKITFFFALLILALPACAVRVLIIEKSSAQNIKTSGRVLIQEAGAKKTYSVTPPSTLKVSISGGNISIGEITSRKSLQIKPQKGTVFTIGQNKYEGTLTIHPSSSYFYITEEILVEDYLYGVLPYEMSYSWPLEALKAQAVAARTYTYKSMQHPVSKNYDLYSDDRSQVYKGSVNTYPVIKKAVDETKNQVLNFDGELFYTYYHANSGGATDPLPWSNTEIKPLKGVKSPGCKNSASYAWEAELTSAYLENMLSKRGAGGELRSVKITGKTKSGRATELTFTTKQTTHAMRCHQFRSSTDANKIKSCRFKSIKKQGKKFVFTGLGFGHGTGMCQDGAKTMAEKGRGYKKILKHYFPGSKPVKIKA